MRAFHRQPPSGGGCIASGAQQRAAAGPPPLTRRPRCTAAGLAAPAHPCWPLPHSPASTWPACCAAAAGAEGDGGGAAGAAGGGGLRARRLLRQQRRQSRQAAEQPEEGADEIEAGQDAAPEDDGSGGEEQPAAASASAPARAPRAGAGAAAGVRSSRAERRRRRSAPRLPAALTPDAMEGRRRRGAAAAADDDGSGDDDEDGGGAEAEATAAAPAAAAAARGQQAQAGAARQARLGAVPAAGAGSGDEEGLDEEESLLPGDLMLLGGEEEEEDGEAEGQEGEEEEEEGAASDGEGEDDAAAAPAARRGAPADGPGPRPRRERVVLPESSPMYLPVLTDEDLAADPPGHRSGYVAVIGRPNAGKSTLINALVGQKLSIVTFKPQTTRHRVVGIASEPAYQMILFDTPGIMREARSRLDERMMAAVVSSIKAAEAIVAVVDADDDPREALSMFQPGPDWSGPPMAVMLNKADLVPPETLAELEEWYRTNCRAEAVFAGTALGRAPGGGGGWAGSGNDADARAAAAGPAVQALKAWAVEKLPEGPTLYPKDMVSDQPERFFVSEIIREKIFLMYDQEIPYSTQVQIAEFKERPGAKDYVSATILVERPGQRGILLGSGGAALKRLGSEARADVEAFLGRPVFLELSVQVAPDWRQHADRLREYGYYDPLYIS
ncbi:GTPase Era [Raphidocelis subcapitata]|uniref:GTPase Era n=1 Tax=Raphidocelis subcapitata TaxID=307507 RepID=A0A2V0PBK4_9CHLO|nr:GTPase Era [Raphidocelis subcapitata]|eukprot:GBF97241.1 GTPase Era [Raphidocelis subcapitata]